MFLFTVTVAPDNPWDVHVVTTGKGSISLAWQPAPDTVNAPVEGYVIEVATGDSNNFTKIGTVDCKKCNFKAKDLEAGQKYNFRIKAQNQSGISSGTTLDRSVVASPLGKVLCSKLSNNFLK